MPNQIDMFDLVVTKGSQSELRQKHLKRFAVQRVQKCVWARAVSDLLHFWLVQGSPCTGKRLPVNGYALCLSPCG